MRWAYSTMLSRPQVTKMSTTEVPVMQLKLAMITLVKHGVKIKKQKAVTMYYFHSSMKHQQVAGRTKLLTIQHSEMNGLLQININ